MHDATRETIRFDDLKWISPVETVDDLPEADGEQTLLCYVQGEDAVYELTNGIWVKSASMGQ